MTGARTLARSQSSVRPTWRSSGSRVAASTATLTLTVPMAAGSVAGDFLVFVIKCFDTLTATDLTSLGWSLAQSTIYGDQMWTKVAGASEPANYVVHKTGTTGNWQGQIHCYKFCSGYDVVAQIVTANGNTVTCPTVTTTVPRTTALFLVGNGLVGTAVFTDPAGSTNRGFHTSAPLQLNFSLAEYAGPDAPTVGFQGAAGFASVAAIWHPILMMLKP